MTLLPGIFDDAICFRLWHAPLKVVSKECSTTRMTVSDLQVEVCLAQCTVSRSAHFDEIQLIFATLLLHQYGRY